MKRLLPALIVTLLSPLVLAQTSPSQTSPAQTPTPGAPSSSMREPSTDGTANYSNGSDDDKSQMKACITKQKQANPQLSQDEIRRQCEKFKPKGEGDR